MNSDLAKIWNALKEVSEKQSEYEKMYIAIKANEDQIAAPESTIVGDVSAQGMHLQDISNIIANIKVSVEELQDRMYIVERKTDELEQYSRSNCLILHGSKLPSSVPNQQVGLDVCEKHVLETLNSNMSLPTALNSSDIDICHPLPSKKNKNPIIIKFVRRTVRNMVFNHKKDFKATNVSSNTLSITESLTKRRLRLLESARKVFQFQNVWTLNGSIFCKFNGRKHFIDDFGDIQKIRLQ